MRFLCTAIVASAAFSITIPYGLHVAFLATMCVVGIISSVYYSVREAIRDDRAYRAMEEKK